MSKVLVLKFNSQDSEQDFLSLARDLKTRGYDFYFLTGVWDLARAFQKQGSWAQKIFAVPEPSTFLDILTFPFWAFYLKLRLLPLLIYFRFKKIRLVYLFGLAEKLALTPWLKLLGYKIFWHQAQSPAQLKFNPYRIFYHFFSRWVKIITTSEFLKEQLVLFRIPAERIQVIYPGFDEIKYTRQADLYHELSKTEYQKKHQGQFLIGTAGRLTLDLGVEYLLKAFRLVHDLLPHIQLVVVGEGPEKQNLIWLTKQLGLGRVAHFAGVAEDAAKWISYFDLFIYPIMSQEEKVSVILEAMFLKKAVVASRLGVIPEIVQNNKTGVLIEPANTEMLSRVVIKLFQNRDWLQQMGENGCQLVKQKFSLAKTVENYQKIWR